MERSQLLNSKIILGAGQIAQLVKKRGANEVVWECSIPMFYSQLCSNWKSDTVEGRLCLTESHSPLPLPLPPEC